MNNNDNSENNEDLDAEDEAYRRILRPSGFMRWLLSWDTEAVLQGGSILIAIIVVVLYLIALIPTSESARDHAKRLLQQQGYEHLEINDVGMWDCGHGDVLNESAAFRGLTPAGMRVEGAVCCGWFKNCTIRYE